jgi:hypothetical protein
MPQHEKAGPAEMAALLARERERDEARTAELRRDAEERLMRDPIFHARVTVAANMAHPERRPGEPRTGPAGEARMAAAFAILLTERGWP